MKEYDYYKDEDGEIYRIPHDTIRGETPTFSDYNPGMVYDVCIYDEVAGEFYSWGDIGEDMIDEAIDAYKWEPITKDELFLEIL